MKFIHWIKFSLAVITAVVLVGCSSTDTPKKAKQEKPITISSSQAKQLDRFIQNLDAGTEQIWGLNEILFEPTETVKYSDNYRTRALINFAEGKIRFETVNEEYFVALQQEIMFTLLMNESPKDSFLYDTYIPVNSSRPPFFVNQIVDNNGQPVRTYEQAQDYAYYLIGNDVRTRKLENGKLVYYIDMTLLKNHLSVRANTYRPLIYKWANEYDIEPRLIFSIMEIESAFNPFAISRSGAIGLMQIVPRTAGTDIFRTLGYTGQPSQEYLFDPNNNIQGGTLYFSLLKNIYLAGITDPTSMRYMMITSYNAGAGGTLSIFSRNREEAIRIINSMTPQEVYDYIVTRHYSAEARNYLLKVSKAYNTKYTGEQ